MKFRARPNCLYWCDPILGGAHFRAPIATGLDIIRGLRCHMSGYAVPQNVIDAPSSGGKIPLIPEYVTGREGDDSVLRNVRGCEYRYPYVM